MLPKIKRLKPLDGFMLQVVFDDGKNVLYNVGEDIESIPSYQDLKVIHRRYLKSYRAVGAIQPQLSGFHPEKDSELSDTD